MVTDDRAHLDRRGVSVRRSRTGAELFGCAEEHLVATTLRFAQKRKRRVLLDVDPIEGIHHEEVPHYSRIS